MLSLLTIASLFLSLGAGVLAEGIEAQEGQLQVIEAVPAADQVSQFEHVEKRNDADNFNLEVATSERQSNKRPNNIAILHPDGQWHKFVFGKVGSTVHLKFVFNLRAPAILTSRTCSARVMPSVSWTTARTLAGPP